MYFVQSKFSICKTDQWCSISAIDSREPSNVVCKYDLWNFISACKEKLLKYLGMENLCYMSLGVFNHKNQGAITNGSGLQHGYHRWSKNTFPGELSC